MAQVDARDAQEKRCHPFFTDLKNRGSPASAGDRSNGNTSADRKGGYESDSGLKKERVKRRKTQTHPAHDTSSTSVPPSQQDPSTSSSLTETGNKSQTLRVLLRARSSQHDNPSLYHKAAQTTSQRLLGSGATEIIQSGASSESAADANSMEDRSSPTRRKRFMRFNSKTGTLASPTKSKSNSTGRPSFLVCIRYGSDEPSRKSIGEGISKILQDVSPCRILTSNEEVSAARTPSHGSKQEKVAQKATHPFFAGGARPPASQETKQPPTKNSPVTKHSVFMSTPVSPARPNGLSLGNHLRSAPHVPTNAFRIKVPGARHPMWPTAGMSHVRNVEDPSMASKSTDSTAYGAYNAPSKKSKGHTTVVNCQEFVIADLIDRLRLDDVYQSLSRSEDDYPLPAEVRLPQKCFESGRKLQRKMKKELARPPGSSLPDIDSSEDELARNLIGKAHAASTHQYHLLVSRLSAFDRSNCESVAWNHKYAPTAANQILQVGQEVELLRQWLMALRVQSVECKGDGKEPSSTLRSARGPRKKRKKQWLKGFVVDSDDEDSEMDAITESEDDETMTGTTSAKKSFIRSGDLIATASKDQRRLKNCILISGPHGCGKTAAVYAVAKELQFEVFEINASSRRSGKDICEKVGDMTRNHLVQHPAPLAKSVSDSLEKSSSPESHKQGLMKTFFKPKTVAKKEATRIRKVGRPAKERQPKDAPSPTQKQSLILLEEADVLFEEDKQFWTTVMSMMAQSKRPFIITCNEENLIPMQSLSLHGIFRFSPPPANLATDLCLLIAAAEGHILSRKAVESLYHSRDRDLRATITELNFWCQIGVGDRRGGFDWFLPRWPRGSDLDEKGDVIRVISQGTYLHGMGWTGHDHPSTTQPSFSEEEEEDQLLDVWESRQLDPAAFVDSLSLGVAASTKPRGTRAPATGATLTSLDGLCSALSDADICAAGSFAGPLQEQVDQTLPALPSETIEDFTVGPTLLEADPFVCHTSTSAKFAIALISRARSVYDEYAAAAEDDPTTTGSPAITPTDQHSVISILNKSFRTQQTQLTRLDVSNAFDPLAAPTNLQASTHRDASVFDRPLDLIIVDVAPWIRGIMAFERQLMQERLRLSNLLSEGGQAKRMRTTRSAYSALEGGERRTTRREKYFGNDVKMGLVMRTGSESFRSAAAAAAAAAVAVEASKVSDWGNAESSGASTRASPE